MTRRLIPQHEFASLARKMYDDDDLVGDVLTLALVLAESLTRQESRQRASGWTRHLGERVVGPRYAANWVRYAVRQDLPRHTAADDGAACVGTMVRRDGPCGQRSTRRHLLRDALTGEQTWIGSCARHHREVGQREDQARAAWADAGRRPGPQNAGGVLERYFTSDWDRIYLWASPGWRRPDSPLEAPRRPHLVLLAGGLLELAD